MGLFFLRGIFINVRIRRIIKSELLFESLEDRLKSAYQKWCKKTKSKRQQTLDNIYDADGYVGELDVYSSDFSDPYSKMYQKAEELYAKEDYEGLLKMIADHQCSGVYIDREFKEWLSYRNLMKSSDIFQYKNEEELTVELWNAKEKSFTKKLKKASAGEDFDKIWENDDMLIVVPKSHVGACKFGQGTKWCTASKTNNYFDSYYKKGILYRVLQKNDNYKELFSNLDRLNKRDIENLSKVSINLRRKENSMSMVDKVDNMFGDEVTSEFLNSLPSEGYKAIKNYQSLNEQNIKTIIREEINDFSWVQDIEPPVFKQLDIATKDDNDINVKWDDDGDFSEVIDSTGHRYFNQSELGLFLGLSYRNWSETINNLGKSNLLLYIKHLIDSIEWNLPREQEDYEDFIKLYKIVEKL